jgi:hypothetical protein
MTARISIIVPVKVGGMAPLEGFAECYAELLRADPLVDVVVPDDSPPDVFERLDQQLDRLPRVEHFRPGREFRTGANGKLNNVRAGLPRAQGDYVLMIDDDYRPTGETMTLLRSVLAPGRVVRAITGLHRPGLADLVERAGMFTGLALAPDYFCGNLAFDRALAAPGFPRSDGLFDELVVMRELRALGAEGHMVIEPWFPIAGVARRKFLQQRVRYAYEMLKHPWRALPYFAIVPLLAALATVSPPAALALAAGLTVGAGLLGLVGQWRYPRLAPAFTWLLAPVYFWFIPFATWFAVGFYLTGGMPFGGRRVKRPA